MEKSKIVDIPIKMEKYYGKGSMLHPSVEDVEELVRTIPKGHVATIDTIRGRLSKDYGTTTTCPLRTGNAIKKIAGRYSHDELDVKVPFWRVIRSDKSVVKLENSVLWASLLEDEGFELLLTKSGTMKVKVDVDRIFRF